MWVFFGWNIRLDWFLSSSLLRTMHFIRVRYAVWLHALTAYCCLLLCWLKWLYCFIQFGNKFSSHSACLILPINFSATLVIILYTKSLHSNCWLIRKRLCFFLLVRFGNKCHNSHQMAGEKKYSSSDPRVLICSFAQLNIAFQIKPITLFILQFSACGNFSISIIVL